MPTVAIVAGIAIVFYYDDHDPAHFHARGAGFIARILISDGSILDVDGRLTARESRILRHWTLLRQEELMENWHRSRASRPLLKIEGDA